jgi:hypothetical protein
MEDIQMSQEQLDTLADEIAVDAATIDSATYELLVKIRQFDQARGWAKQGAKSCGHWLSWRIGVGLVAANQKVFVAHRLLEFPRIAEAFRRGELSYTKVRACVREHMPPDKDEVLLHLARGATGAQLEKICAAYRRIAPGSRATDAERRYVRKRTHQDGTVSVEFRLLPDEAERLYQAVSETKREMTAARRGDRNDDPGDDREDDSAESSPPPRRPESAHDDSAESSSPTLVDAAVVMAEAQLARVNRPAEEETPATRSVPAAERRQLFVHLREERIADTSSWKAELHDGTPLSRVTLSISDAAGARSPISYFAPCSSGTGTAHSRGVGSITKHSSMRTISSIGWTTALPAS